MSRGKLFLRYQFMGSETEMNRLVVAKTLEQYHEDALPASLFDRIL